MFKFSLPRIFSNRGRQRERVANRSKNSLSAVFRSLVFLVLSAVVASVVVNPLLEFLKCNDLQETKGTIIKAEIIDKSGRNPTSEFKVAYTFSTGDHSYTGHRVSFFDNNTYKGARSYAQRFPVGTEVPVYFDPQNPTKSVLLAEVSWVAWVLVGISLFLMILGIEHLRSAFKE
jgi:hypothetical protein